MGIFIFGCLAACLVFFLAMACIACIKIEKGVVDLTELAEHRVKEMYDTGK